jgi:hypothetical protein
MARLISLTPDGGGFPDGCKLSAHRIWLVMIDMSMLDGLGQGPAHGNAVRLGRRVGPLIATALLVLVLVSCGGETTRTIGGEANPLPCTTRQLKGELGAAGGAIGTGNWTAQFWIVDTSRTACVVKPPAQVEFLDETQTVRLSAATSAFSPVTLAAHGTFPTNPSRRIGGLLALGLSWPSTPPDVNFHRPYTPGPCPHAVLVPATMQVIFGKGAVVTIGPLTGAGNTDGPGVAFCDTAVAVLVGPSAP